MEDAGAAAVVLHSLFEEQIDLESSHLDRYLAHGTDSFAESLTYFPDLESYNLGPGRLPGACPPGQGGGGDPGHRQPERRLDRAAGSSTRGRSRRRAPTRWS